VAILFRYCFSKVKSHTLLSVVFYTVLCEIEIKHIRAFNWYRNRPPWTA